MSLLDVFSRGLRFSHRPCDNHEIPLSLRTPLPAIPACNDRATQARTKHTPVAARIGCGGIRDLPTGLRSLGNRPPVALKRVGSAVEEAAIQARAGQVIRNIPPSLRSSRPAEPVTVDCFELSHSIRVHRKDQSNRVTVRKNSCTINMEQTQYCISFTSFWLVGNRQI